MRSQSVGISNLSVDETVAANGTWAEAVADFFEAQNAFETAGQPAQWENKWWDATFSTTLNDGDEMPKVKRHGWVLENWRYGNEDGYYHARSIDGHGKSWDKWLKQYIQKFYYIFAK